MGTIVSTIRVGQKPTKEERKRMKDVLAKYKALGRGYSGIMADVLRLAADNPEILNKVRF